MATRNSRKKEQKKHRNGSFVSQDRKCRTKGGGKKKGKKKN